jgi:hypothetical protein
MKTKILAILLGCLLLTACDEKGENHQYLNGNETNLPDELKGLKVYSVCVSPGNWVKVAILDNKIKSTTYMDGKFSESVLIVDKSTGKIITVSSIIVENDSIIVARK